MFDVIRGMATDLHSAAESLRAIEWLLRELTWVIVVGQSTCMLLLAALWWRSYK